MFWPPTRGDNLNQVERIVLTGITSSNSDKGKHYLNLTATVLEVYKDRELTSKVAEVSGGHLGPTTWTKATLTATNGSGLSGSIYFRYLGTDASIEVFATLCTDAEMDVAFIDFARWPKQTGQSTFENQHQKTREDFVRKLRQKVPPVPRRGFSIGGLVDQTVRGDVSSIWRVNSIGDYELARLQNVADYIEWARHYTFAGIARTANRILKGGEEQLELITDEEAAAEAAFAEIVPLVDADQDYDADDEVNPFHIARGGG